MLTKVAETLNVQPEKLESAVERLVEEWKESRRERDRLLKELVEKEGKESSESGELMRVQPLADVKLATRLFEPVDVDRMVKTASELVKKDPAFIAVFYGKDEKTGRIVVMVGKEALKRGVDARVLANEAASKLGGGGSGRPDFAQGGGTHVRKLAEAVKEAEEALRRQLKSKG